MQTFLFVGLRWKRGYGQGRARPDQERRGGVLGVYKERKRVCVAVGWRLMFLILAWFRELGGLNALRHTGSGKVDWVGAYGPVYAPSVFLVAGNQRYRREHWRICHRKKLSWTEGPWDTGLFWYLHVSRPCCRLGLGLETMW